MFVFFHAAFAICLYVPHTKHTGHCGGILSGHTGELQQELEDDRSTISVLVLGKRSPSFPQCILIPTLSKLISLVLFSKELDEHVDLV